MNTKLVIHAILACVAMLASTSSQSHAGVILAMADSNVSSTANNQFFSNLFNGKSVYGRYAGTSWTLQNWDSRIAANGGSYSAGALTPGALVGKDWVATSTNTAWSASELNTLSNFINAGGSVVVIGEGTPNYSAINSNANQILNALGSSMSFRVSGSAASGSTTIHSDPLTAGVSNFAYNFAGGINGGTKLVSTSLPGGENVIVAYENALTNAVPEPASFAIFGTIVALGCVRRRRA